MKFINKTLVALSVIAIITGCSPEEQDIVDETQTLVVANGAVIDPLITSAIVFADFDNDGVLDSFEPWAFTDENGYYSVGINGEDYCTTTPKYCLELPNSDPVKLVAVGGYDLTTLKKVNSRLSRTFSGSGDQFITPLTSVGDISLNDLETIDQNVNILIDAFESDDTAFSLAFKVHKIVELISELVVVEYPLIGNDENFPTDISGYVYDAINQLSTDQNISLTTLLDELTDDQVDNILDDVRTELDSLIINQSSVVSLNITKETTSSIVSTSQLSANELALALRNFVTQYDVAINNTTEAGITIEDDNAIASIRLLEGIKDLFTDAIENNTTISDSTLTDIIDDIFESNTLLDNLSDTFFDASLLNLNSQTELEDSLVTMSERPQLPDTLNGMQLYLSDSTSSRDAIVGLFFTNSNDLTACVKFQNLVDTSDSQNTNGTLLTGSWEQTEYSIDLGLTVAGTEEALRIRTNTTDTYIFDYDDEETEWESTVDFTTTTDDVPTTDETCQAWIESLSNS